MHGWVELLKEWAAQDSSFNVYPSASVPAFRAGKGEIMRWGLIPHWAEEFKSSYATHNARLETVEESKTYKFAWRKGQRCLVPMAGFYEWKGPKGSKQPYYATTDGGLCAAGLWEEWQGHYSCTIITREADPDIEWLHHRMPVLLQPENADEWLNMPVRSAQHFARTATKPDLNIYPVSKAVNNPRNNGPELLEPIQL